MATYSTGSYFHLHNDANYFLETSQVFDNDVDDQLKKINVA